MRGSEDGEAEVRGSEVRGSEVRPLCNIGLSLGGDRYLRGCQSAGNCSSASFPRKCNIYLEGQQGQDCSSAMFLP